MLSNLFKGLWGLTLYIYVSLISAKAYAVNLQVGFAQLPVTPEIVNNWADVNNDSKFDPDIDTLSDGNGIFDPVWIADFQKSRAAQGVKDDLMAVAVAIDDGDSRIAIVALDTNGLLRKFALDVRESVPAAWGIDFLMVHATHNHEGPDTQGRWGPGLFSSGIDPDYMAKLKRSTLEAVEAAISNLEPAEVSIARISANPRTPIKDKRKPIVIDDHIRALLFRRPDQSIIRTLVNFDVHVELAWDKNLLLTSDIAGYLRRGISRGIYYHEELRLPGLGGTTLWLTVNIGGLMTSGPNDPVYDLFLQREITFVGHGKARAFGHSLARSVINAANQGHFTTSPIPQLSVRAREIELGIDNFILSLATLMGVVDSEPRLHLSPPFVRYLSGVAFIQLGNATITAIPGELYPEIAVDGIQKPEGADYKIPAQEVPNLRSQLPGQVNLMVNLANDAIGYIIPKSEWDTTPPWLYGKADETYGEIVSLGPETAPAIHRAIIDAIKGDE